VQNILKAADSSPLNRAITLGELLRRPELSYNIVTQLAPPPDTLPNDVCESVEVELKYDGYIQRQEAQVDRFRNLEKKYIPYDFDYATVSALRNEAIEKFTRIKPRSLGQASRIPGISPSDISVLMIMLKKRGVRT
jgi:tRNA uridine 5-carboxymethylaminomethyl modification enzyme